MPAISVVMPVYNRAHALPRAIRSVLDQSFADFELVIVDDGSKDDSAAVAGATGDPRVKVISLGQNRGGNAARNAGVRASAAPLVAFLDSDDAYLPHKLAAVHAIFADRPEIDLLIDSFMKVEPGQPIETGIARRNKPIDDQDEFLKALFTRRLWKATPSITVRRATIIKAGMFDETLRRLQDFDLLIRAAAVGRCVATDRVLWLKHESPDAITIEDTWIAANLELCRRHPQYRTNREFRPGLAYAVRRGVMRRLSTGRLSAAWRDLRNVARAFGWRDAIALLVEGFRRRPRLS